MSWAFDGSFMGFDCFFCGGFIGFYGDFIGFYGDFIGFYGGFMGCKKDILLIFLGLGEAPRKTPQSPGLAGRILQGARALLPQGPQVIGHRHFWDFFFKHG